MDQGVSKAGPREPVPYGPEKPKEKPKIVKVVNEKKPLPVKVETPKKEKKPFDPCNCWSYVKFKRAGKMKTGYGKARNYPVNSQVPQIGAIIITYESASGHMGIVAGINENKVIIDDWNYERCKHTIRELPLNSKLIKGYIL